MSRTRKRSTTSPPRPQRRKGDIATDKVVYEAIRRAMHMGRLSAGTKLQEPALARVLNVSRERVRKALHRLVHEGWLEAVPNRGTFVPTLTIREMREIYDVRMMLETAIVRRLSVEHGARAARRLKAHVNKERQAVKTDDRGRLFGLSGDFHVLLAELCGNEQLTKLLRGLLARSTMHFSLAAPERFHNCAGPHDHADIVKEILDRNAEKADKLMLDHLLGLVELQSAPPPFRGAAGLDEAFRDISAA
jgi:DNA-binding GntR family transcriptional regulator